MNEPYLVYLVTIPSKHPSNSPVFRRGDGLTLVCFLAGLDGAVLICCEKSVKDTRPLIEFAPANFDRGDPLEVAEVKRLGGSS